MRISSDTNISYSLWLIITFLGFYLLYLGKSLLIPLVIAVFLWYLINVLAVAFRGVKFFGLRLPKWICFVLSLVAILGGLFYLVDLISSNIYDVIRKLPEYQENFNQIVLKLFQKYNFSEPPKARDILNSVDLRGVFSQFAVAITTIIRSVGIIFIYLMFLFMEQRSFPKKINALIEDGEQKEKVVRIIQTIGREIRVYIGIKTLTSTLTGAMSYLVLALVGVDFAKFWAILIFLLNYIPTIGSIIATVFPAIITLIQFYQPVPFFIITGGIGALQVLIGNVLEPRLMGNSLNLSPLVILLSLALWGKLWGVPGMFLCVPLTVVSVIIFSHFSRTQPIAIFLSRNGNIKDPALSRVTEKDQITLS